jgi:hypothetical protein
MPGSLKRGSFGGAAEVPELAQSVPDAEVARVTHCVTREAAHSKNSGNPVTHAVLRKIRGLTTKVTRGIALISKGFSKKNTLQRSCVGCAS